MASKTSHSLASSPQVSHPRILAKDMPHGTEAEQPLIEQAQGNAQAQTVKGGGCDVVPSQTRRTTGKEDARRSAPTKVSEVSFCINFVYYDNSEN